jgi:hypothetical protein
MVPFIHAYVAVIAHVVTTDISPGRVDNPLKRTLTAAGIHVAIHVAPDIGKNAGL